MTDTHVKKMHLIGSGYAEMPKDGRRFRFRIERYRHDDGTEWGQITSMEEIPDVGPYLWVPSWGAENADEVEHMLDELHYEEANPTAEKAAWDGGRAESRRLKFQMYDELRDERAKRIKRSPRTLQGARS